MTFSKFLKTQEVQFELLGNVLDLLRSPLGRVYILNAVIILQGKLEEALQHNYLHKRNSDSDQEKKTERLPFVHGVLKLSWRFQI